MSEKVASAESLKQEILEQVKTYWEVAHQPKTFVPGESVVPYAGRVFGPEEMTSLISSSLDFWLTMGPYGEQFESRLQNYYDASKFLLVNSGSTANLLAVMTLAAKQVGQSLVPGDEVITCAVGFPTTVGPLVQCGLVPVFVDAEMGTYNIDPNQIEAAITDKTKAIMIAHTLGVPCDMDVISEIAKKHKLLLVEDCCDALGSTFNGQKVGTFGDLATLSFYPAHHITMGEGGGVVVNNPRFAKIAESIRDWGRDCWCAPGVADTCGKRFDWQLGGLPQGYDHKYIYSRIGFNFKATDMQAAIGVAQLDRLEDFIAARKTNFTKLYEGLKPFEDRLILPVLDERNDPAWFGFPITVKEGTDRAHLVQGLEAAKIQTRMVFGGNLLRQPAFADVEHRAIGDLPVADQVMQNTFFIGVYPGLTDTMLDYVIQTFGDLLK